MSKKNISLPDKITFLFPCTLLVMGSDVAFTGSGAKEKKKEIS